MRSQRPDCDGGTEPTEPRCLVITTVVTLQVPGGDSNDIQPGHQWPDSELEPRYDRFGLVIAPNELAAPRPATLRGRLGDAALVEAAGGSTFEAVHLCPGRRLAPKPAPHRARAVGATPLVRRGHGQVLYLLGGPSSPGHGPKPVLGSQGTRGDR